MKRVKVSNNVIRRLPRYLRKLDELTDAGVSRISSGELGRQLGLTPSQIRQDFSCFGEFGQQGYGYKVTALRAEIASILGMDRGYSAILIGVGNLGQALLCNFSFKAWGFDLKAAFDVKPQLIGTDYEGVKIHDMATLPQFLSENKVDAAVLCVPKGSRGSDHRASHIARRERDLELHQRRADRSREQHHRREHPLLRLSAVAELLHLRG